MQFDIATREWTWRSGGSALSCSDIVDKNGTYGIYCWLPAVFGVQGTPDPADNPGGRTALGAWRDLAGNLRLFGGDYFFGKVLYDRLVLDTKMDDQWIFHPESALPRATTTPKISLASGTYSSAQSVTITDAASGAAIYYTTDGTTPTEKSELYIKPIQLDHNGVLKAMAVANGLAPSMVTQATYVFQWSFNIVMAAGSPAGVNIPVGSSGSFTLALNPVLGSTFPSQVSLSVSGLPLGATATFNPSSIAKGSSRSTVILSIQTREASAMRSDGSRASLFLCFACVPFLLINARRRFLVDNVAIRVLVWGAFLGLTLSVVSACGGGGTSSGGSGGGGGGGGPTPAGSYPLNVTATCGQMQSSITVTAQVE